MSTISLFHLADTSPFGPLLCRFLSRFARASALGGEPPTVSPGHVHHSPTGHDLLELTRLTVSKGCTLAGLSKTHNCSRVSSNPPC